jgi:hypothetical protein
MARRKQTRQLRPTIHGFACLNCASGRIRLGTVNVATFELRCAACGYVWSQAPRRPFLPGRGQ